MSDETKKTAVERFIEQLEEKGDLRETPSIRNIQLNIDTTEYLDLKRQALQMEKERMKGMYVEGSFAKMRYYDGLEYIEAEQYYQENYGGNK
jgi:hypothetical protein